MHDYVGLNSVDNNVVDGRRTYLLLIECSKQLASGGFFLKEEHFYCGEDYQRLFGTKCSACGQFVEGEVVKALGNTYHQTCFQCTKCK